MTDDTTLWKTLQKSVPRERWVALSEIFLYVQEAMSLDSDDLKRANSRSGVPRWQANVRRILHAKHLEGTIRRRTFHSR